MLLQESTERTTCLGGSGCILQLHHPDEGGRLSAQTQLALSLLSPLTPGKSLSSRSRADFWLSLPNGLRRVHRLPSEARPEGCRPKRTAPKANGRAAP